MNLNKAQLIILPSYSDMTCLEPICGVVNASITEHWCIKITYVDELPPRRDYRASNRRVISGVGRRSGVLLHRSLVGFARCQLSASAVFTCWHGFCNTMHRRRRLGEPFYEFSPNLVNENL